MHACKSWCDGESEKISTVAYQLNKATAGWQIYNAISACLVAEIWEFDYCSTFVFYLAISVQLWANYV
jgi:hypothetical protein